MIGYGRGDRNYGYWKWAELTVAGELTELTGREFRRIARLGDWSQSMPDLQPPEEWGKLSIDVKTCHTGPTAAHRIWWDVFPELSKWRASNVPESLIYVRNSLRLCALATVAKCLCEGKFPESRNQVRLCDFPMLASYHGGKRRAKLAKIWHIVEEKYGDIPIVVFVAKPRGRKQRGYRPNLAVVDPKRLEQYVRETRRARS